MRRATGPGSVHLALAACLLSAPGAGLLGGCERPPVGPVDDEPPAPGRVGPLALEQFTQDRPAIGGKWYVYDPSGHALEPKPEAWILREGSTSAARHAAFRIVSIYETERAASGRFTLELALHDGTAWGAPRTWLAPRNIKDTGPLCVDLFAAYAEAAVTNDDGAASADGAAPAGSDVDCAGDAWQLRLAMQNRFSTSAGITVAEPALFVRSAAGTEDFGSVRVARLDNVMSLADLPAPATLEALADAPASSWESTDWGFGALAPDLPEAGMAIGARAVGPGFTARPDVYWLVSGRFDVVRFTVAPVAEGDPEAGLRFRYAQVEGDFEDWSAPATLPDDVTVDVAMPEPGGARWLSFSEAALIASPEDVGDARWPHAPPRAPSWDLALVRPRADVVFLLVSPFACTLNATALELDVERPPASP